MGVLLTTATACAHTPGAQRGRGEWIGGEHAGLLACETTYGGETQTVVAHPATDPYAVRASHVDERFELKVVWVRSPADEARIAIYTYYTGDAGPVLVHVLKYRPPYPVAEPHARHGFTGLQHVYEPRLAGELQFWCGWKGP